MLGKSDPASARFSGILGHYENDCECGFVVVPVCAPPGLRDLRRDGRPAKAGIVPRGRFDFADGSVRRPRRWLWRSDAEFAGMGQRRRKLQRWFDRDSAGQGDGDSNVRLLPARLVHAPALPPRRVCSGSRLPPRGIRLAVPHSRDSGDGLPPPVRIRTESGVVLSHTRRSLRAGAVNSPPLSRG